MVMAQQPVQHWNLGVGPISCHAWNKDRTQLAVSPSNNEIHVFEWSGGQWKRKHVLTEHDLPVTGIDWAPNTNRIVSCSQDKNAFVWTADGANWKPELVLVRINRGATSVKWSPLENKFAVGSAAKLVSVCYYEKENDWWVSKQIKKPIRSTVTCIDWHPNNVLLAPIRSTVTCIDWHPNNVLLAVGACDFKTRVFSAYVKEVDEKPAPNPWGTKMPFGAVMAEYSNGGGGWVHAVRFSPSGCRLGWVGHDSSISVVDANDSDKETITTIKEWYLPFTSLEWATENSVVAAGHDCCPMLFTFEGTNKLKFVSKLDVPSEQKSGNVSSAFERFKTIDRYAASEAVDVNLKTLHQNTVTQICAHTGSKGSVAKFSTSGIDGLLVLWDLKGLEAKVASIKWREMAGGSGRCCASMLVIMLSALILLGAAEIAIYLFVRLILSSTLCKTYCWLGAGLLTIFFSASVLFLMVGVKKRSGCLVIAHFVVIFLLQATSWTLSEVYEWRLWWNEQIRDELRVVYVQVYVLTTAWQAAGVTIAAVATLMSCLTYGC
uniref:Arp2/3 complex 41 kDa subunit n=1 Tax=Plectus sambesii TaxID=2011161 RepID=A0A914ULA8_9BILA